MVRPPGPLCDRSPPRRSDEMSSSETRLAVFDSPCRARSLFTVRAGNLFGKLFRASGALFARLYGFVLTLSFFAPRTFWHRILLCSSEQRRARDLECGYS